MGTWGAGVYDSDAGIETYKHFTEQFIKGIEQSVEDPRLEIEDLDGPLAQAAMLGTLAEHAKSIRLDRARIAKWKKRFLEVFDAEIDELDAPEDFVEARRNVIEETFDRIARGSYDDSAPPKGKGATGPLNVGRAMGAGKAAAIEEKAAKAGVTRGPKKKLEKK